MKKIIAANISKLIEFGNAEDLDAHIRNLEQKKRTYAILSRKELEDGKVLVEIKEQYNGSDLL